LARHHLHLEHYKPVGARSFQRVITGSVQADNEPMAGDTRRLVPAGHQLINRTLTRIIL